MTGQVLSAVRPTSVASPPNQRLLHRFVESRVWVAGAATGLAAYSIDYLELSLALRPLLIVFASALLIYRLDRWVDARGSCRAPTLTSWLLPLVLCVGVLVGSSSRLLFVVAPGLLLCCVYALPLRRRGRSRRALKQIPGFKAVFVAGSLTTATVAVPLLHAGVVPPLGLVSTLVGFLFLFTLTNVTTFDLRDQQSDRQTGTLTFPVLWGAAWTRRVLLALQATLLGVGLLGDLPVAPEMILASALGLGLLWKLPPAAPAPRHELLVDGLALVLPLLAVASSCFARN